MRILGWFVVGILSALAQNVVITVNDILPVNSTTYYITDTTQYTNFSPGPSGIGQSWSFTIDTLRRDTIEILPPSSTPYANSFPSANRVEKYKNIYTYENLQPSKLEWVGFVVDTGAASIPAIMQPTPLTQVTFPYQVGSVIQDTAWFVVQVPVSGFLDSIRTKTTLITRYEADGDGTLTVNGQTYNNVIRTVAYKYQEDSVWGLLSGIGWQLLYVNPTRLDATTYSWIGKNEKTRVFSLIYDSQGTLIEASFLENSIVRQSQPQPLQAVLYPNPASSWLTIQLHTPLQGQLNIYDFNGRKLFTLPLRGKNTYTIPLSHFPEGNYFILVETSKSNYFARFNVVH